MKEEQKKKSKHIINGFEELVEESIATRIPITWLKTILLVQTNQLEIENYSMTDMEF